MSDWQEQQHADECHRQQEALEALRAARALGLPASQLMALAYEAGVVNEFYQEIRK